MKCFALSYSWLVKSPHCIHLANSVVSKLIVQTMKLPFLFLLTILTCGHTSLNGETTINDRYEIFTVYPASKSDSKYSVLLDKVSGRMWRLDTAYFDSNGGEKTVQEHYWTPEIKFNKEGESLIWRVNLQKSLDESIRKK